MRLTRRLLLWAAPGLLAAACLSPTLPLPPPEAPDVQQIGQGQYRLTGVIPAPGVVLVLNQRSRDIVGKDVEGAYELIVSAKPRDVMRVWYQSGYDASDYAEFDIPDDPLPVPDAGSPSRDAGAD